MMMKIEIKKEEEEGLKEMTMKNQVLIEQEEQEIEIIKKMKELILAMMK